jgi:hypothetical protein
MTTIKIAASEIREGDYIPGLDNGYVVEDPEHDPDFRDRYNMGLGRGKVCITFNTAEEDEAYLLCPPDMPVTINREG